ncbi:hypothetical protein LIER_37878 [Lithospermum erythrorhizon]|uniref:Uncharacterized protein n=1 Tax=Lithospermum erythrorhizon TaxID=34254 RepID=A0AAV3PU37_LITER
MEPPNSYNEVQKLTGCLAALNRFIYKSGERNLPFFKNLGRMSMETFTWDEESNKAFVELKEYLVPNYSLDHNLASPYSYILLYRCSSKQRIDKRSGRGTKAHILCQSCDAGGGVKVPYN